jgi:hypothetical protein
MKTDFAKAADLAHLTVEEFGNLVLEQRDAKERENERLRKALLPFAAAAGRPGRLLNCMDDKPLPDDVALGLGVKVSAWKEAIRLTTAEKGGSDV